VSANWRVGSCQEWWGVTDEIKRQAQYLHEQKGYRVLIPDLYKGKLGVDAEEAGHVSCASLWSSCLCGFRLTQVCCWQLMPGLPGCHVMQSELMRMTLFHPECCQNTRHHMPIWLELTACQSSHGPICCVQLMGNLDFPQAVEEIQQAAKWLKEQGAPKVATLLAIALPIN